MAKVWIVAPTAMCHPERSEGSPSEPTLLRSPLLFDVLVLLDLLILALADALHRCRRALLRVVRAQARRATAAEAFFDGFVIEAPPVAHAASLCSRCRRASCPPKTTGGQGLTPPLKIPPTPHNGFRLRARPGGGQAKYLRRKHLCGTSCFRNPPPSSTSLTGCAGSSIACSSPSADRPTCGRSAAAPSRRSTSPTRRTRCMCWCLPPAWRRMPSTSPCRATF